MNSSFVLRASARGYNHFLSTGESSSYIGGHPDATLTRHSSFDFGPYQGGQRGFGRVRVFGDELFSGPGCGYNIHPHHNFIICAFVLKGQLTHINTVGNIDQLTAGDYYAFSAGSGGKHCELNLKDEDLNVLYLWMLPDQLLLPPSYSRGHYEAAAGRNRLVTLVGNADGALRVSQNVQVSRLAADPALAFEYRATSPEHGLYVICLEGEARVNDTLLSRRDSSGIWGNPQLQISAGGEGCDLLIVESAP